MPAPANILGNYFVSVGYATTLTNSTTGGTWSSSDNSIATVSAGGLVTGVAAGAVVITYTINGTATWSIEVEENCVTNGFNIDALMPALSERIGWDGATSPGYPTLTVANQKSKSGRYYNDFHEAVTIKNISDTQENNEQTNDEFNTLLATLDRKVSLRALNGIFNQPCLIEHMLAYNRTYNRVKIIVPNGGNFVGYRVNVAAGDFAAVFNSISLYFNGVATFNLYLFNDLIKLPIRTKSVTTVQDSQTKVQLGWTVNYNDYQYSGGVYFIGYMQNDLGSVQAIDEQLNLWTNSCVFGGLPFQSKSIGNNDFDRNQPSPNFRSYGLNIEMSAYRDFTRVITQNIHIFDEARGLLMAISIIEQFKNTTRTNTSEKQITDMIDKWSYDVNGMLPNDGQPYVAGLKDQLKRAFKTIAETFNPKEKAISVPASGNGNYIEYLGFNLNNLPRRQ